MALMVKSGLMSYITPGGIYVLTVGFKSEQKNREYDNKGIFESVKKVFWTKN